jgi:hypothetical protein
MTTYSLYVKTHRVTGLKYLGYTKSTNPHKYKGSGKYWKDHIKLHDYLVDTDIIFRSANKTDIKQQGLYYSKLWNVVQARDKNGKKIWANLKEEAGDGGKPAWESSMENPVIKERHTLAINDPVIKQKQKDATIAAMNSVKVQTRLRGTRNTTAYKEYIKTTLNSPELLAVRSKKDKNPNFDHMVYNFIHNDGTMFTGTKFDFRSQFNLDTGNLSRMMSRITNSTKGWRLAD